MSFLVNEVVNFIHTSANLPKFNNISIFRTKNYLYDNNMPDTNPNHISWFMERYACLNRRIKKFVGICVCVLSFDSLMILYN